MKALVRFWGRIREDEKKNRTVFWALILFSFVLGILFTFLYGNLSSYLRNRETDNPNLYRHFSVSYDAESLDARPGLPEDGIRALLQSEEVESVLVAGLSEEGRIVYCLLKGKHYYYLKDERGKTDPALLKSGEVLAILPYPMQAGTSLRLNGQSFTVVGTAKILENTMVYVSREDFEKLGLEPKSAEIYSVHREDFESREETLKKSEVGRILTSRFPAIGGVAPTIEIPDSFNEKKESDHSQRQLYIAYGFCLLAMIVMTDHIVESSSYSYSIERICGCKKRRIATSLLCEYCAITVLPAFFGVGFHAAFYEPLFRHFNLQQYVEAGTASFIKPGALHYYGSDYVQILTILAGLHLGFAFLFLARRLALTPVEMKRKAL